MTSDVCQNIPHQDLDIWLEGGGGLDFPRSREAVRLLSEVLGRRDRYVVS